jgi:hypothetical protein
VSFRGGVSNFFTCTRLEFEKSVIQFPPDILSGVFSSDAYFLISIHLVGVVAPVASSVAIFQMSKALL